MLQPDETGSSRSAGAAPVTDAGTLLATRTKSSRSSSGVHRSNQNLACVWQGLNRARWREVVKELPPDPRYRLRRLSISILSAMNSAYEACESALYRRRIEQTEVTQPPIFVLGHWRSGTTLLHNLLTLDPQLTFPTLYQVMF